MLVFEDEWSSLNQTRVLHFPKQVVPAETKQPGNAAIKYFHCHQEGHIMANYHKQAQVLVTTHDLALQILKKLSISVQSRGYFNRLNLRMSFFFQR